MCVHVGMKPLRFFIKEHWRQRRKAKMKFENVSELFISSYCMKQIKSVLTLNAISAACSWPNSQRTSFTTSSLRCHLLHKRQRETETERDQELGTVACSSVPSGHYQSHDRCELLYLPHFAQRRAEEMLFDLLLLMQGHNGQDP